MIEVSPMEYMLDRDSWFLKTMKGSRQSGVAIVNGFAKSVYFRCFNIERDSVSASKYFRLTDEEVERIVLPRII